MTSLTMLMSLEDQSLRSFPSCSSGTCLVAHCMTDVQTSSSSMLSSSLLRKVINVSFGKTAKSFDLKIISGCEAMILLQQSRSLFKEAAERANLWTVKIFC